LKLVSLIERALKPLACAQYTLVVSKGNQTVARHLAFRPNMPGFSSLCVAVKLSLNSV